ncbi:ESPR-type extended signal peptide-containing protein [uncultured Dialister sp.]|uniref:ESPR-type extended signal peptide-containing protein n=1 Tax=uncultured Dialister sp. TaxID=278064 RepID=UPI00263696AB|nr:ESPR-type extended signal peptide-containing protein [uncultured Dialister sp.]
MNKIFKVIFSKAKGCYVVVSELAKSAGKGTSASHTQRGYKLTLAAAVLSMMMGMAPVGAADPVDLGNNAKAAYDDKGNLTIGNEGTVAEGTKQAGQHNTTIGTDSDTLRNVTEGETKKDGQPLDGSNTKLVDGEGKAHPLDLSTEAGGSTAVGYQNKAEGDNSTAIGNNAKITNKPVTYYVDADGKKTASPENAVWYKDSSGNPTKVPQVFRDAGGNKTTTPQYVHTYTEKDPDTKEDVTKTEITSDAAKADQKDGQPVYNYQKSDNTPYLYTVTLYQAASNSIAAGTNVTANGSNAVVVGYGSTADNSAVAIGDTAAAAGDNTIAIGTGSTATDTDGTGSIAIGKNVEANKTSTAVGLNGTKASSGSSAYGNNAVAEYSSSAFGSGVQASGGSYASGMAGTKDDEEGHSVPAPITATNGSYATGMGGTSANNGGMAVGNNVSATNSSYATGMGGTSATNGSMAVGNNVKAGDKGGGAFAVGMGGTTADNSSMAVGDNVQATGSAFASGRNETSAENGGIAYGDNVHAQYGGFAAGTNNTSASSGVAVGSNVHAYDGSSYAGGMNGTTAGNGSIAFGNNVHAGTSDSDSDSGSAFAAGMNGTTADDSSVAVGDNVHAAGGSYAAGMGGTSASSSAVAIGNNVHAAGGSYAAGMGGTSASSSAVAIGNNAYAYGSSYAFGSSAHAESNSTAIGSSSTAKGGSYAFGSSADADNSSYAIGNSANARSNSMAIGSSAKSNVDGGIALGSNSTVYRGATAGLDPRNGQPSENTTPTWKSTYGALSIGAVDSDGNVTGTRQIIGVAAGTKDTDAVNLAQLKQVAQGFSIHDYGVNSVDTTTDTNYNNAGAQGNNSLAAGVSAKATGTNAVAIGTGATAAGVGATVIGQYGEATGRYALAFGGQQTDTTAEQADNMASGDNALSFGERTTASGTNSTAFGWQTTAKEKRATAFGERTTASGANATAFGQLATASGQNSVAFGNEAVANNYGSTAFGNRTEALGEYSTAFGNSTVAAGMNTVAFGTDNVAGAVLDENGAYTNIIYQTDPKNGRVVKDTKGNPIELSREKMDARGNLAYLDSSSHTKSVTYTVPGGETHSYVLLQGEDGNTYIRDYRGNIRSAVIGDDGTVTVGDKPLTGVNLKQANAGANGYHILSNANATVWGENSIASGEASTAFGVSSIAAAKNSLAALGGTVAASATNAAAIGSGAKATLEDSVALGSNSVTTRAKYKDLTSDAEKAAYAKGTSTGSAWEATDNAIAVGNDSTVTRQITGVAAGSLDTDAVNVAQLKAVDARHTTVSVGGEKAKADDTVVKGGNLEMIRATSNGQANYDVSLNKDIVLGQQEENKGGSIVINSVGTFRNYDDQGNYTDYPMKEAVKIDGTTISVVKHDGSDGDNDQRQVVMGVGQDTGGYVALYDNTGKKPTYIFNAISPGITYLKDKATYPNDANEFGRLEYGDIYNGSTQFIATLDDGLKFSGDQGSLSTVKLNQELSVTGGVKTADSLSDGSNIGVVSTPAVEDKQGNITQKAKLELKLNKDLTGLNTVTAGNAKIGSSPADTLKLTENGAVTEKTAPAGSYVTGLDNKDWNTTNPSYVSGRAATEDQLAAVSGTINQGLSFITNTQDATNTTDNYTGYKVVNRKLGDTIAIKAGDADTSRHYATTNLTTEIANNGDITIKMDENPTFNIVTATSVNLSPKDTTTKDQAGNTASARLDAHYRDASLNPNKNVTMADGSTGMVRLHYHDGEGTIHDLATMDDGQIYAGDIKEDGTLDTTGFGRKMNEMTTINGGVTDKDKLTNNNIGVVSNGTDTLTVKLAKNLKNLQSVQTGKTTMDDNGLTIRKSDDDSSKNVIVLGDKVAFGDNQVNHMGSGSDGTADGKPTYNTDTNGANIGDVKNIVSSTVQPVIDTVNKGWELDVNGTKQKAVTPDSPKVNLIQGQNITIAGDTDNTDNVTISTADDVRFNTVRVGGAKTGTTYSGGILIGSQSGKNADGTESANSNVGNYITGLENTNWDSEKIQHGRAATEDQLQAVATEIKNGTVKGDVFVTGGAVSYKGEGKGADPKDKDGTGSINLTRQNAIDVTIGGLHDYYVTGGTVTNDGKTLELTRNDKDASGNPQKISVDLSNVLSNDQHLVANPVAGSGGKYTVDTTTGTVTLKVQNPNSADGSGYSDITIGGFEGLGQGLKFGANKMAKDGGGNPVTNQLGSTIKITGAGTKELKDYSGKNLLTSVEQDDQGNTIVHVLMDKNISADGVTVGQAGKDGVAGADGEVGQAGTIGINGKNGVAGTDGKQGITTTIIRTEKGQTGKDGEIGQQGAPGVDGKDITRIVYQNDQDKVDGKDGSHTVATLDDGLKFSGDDNKVITKKLNEQLQFVGGADKSKLTENNIGINELEDGKLTIQLVNTPKLGENGNLTAGKAQIGWFAGDTLDMTKDGTNPSGNKAKAGSYATGLSNKDWSVTDPEYVSGRAATEDQLAKVSEAIGNATTAAGKRTVVTVNDKSNPAEATPSATPNAYGDYDSTGGNLMIAAKKDSEGVLTYNIKLNDQLAIGQKGEPGVAGKDGKDGKVTVETKGGTTVVIGHDGKDGDNGRDGLFVTGKDGANGKSGVSITGPNGTAGTDGVDGKVGIAGKDGKDAVSISGKDGVGHIGLTGPKGADGTPGKDGISIDITMDLKAPTLDSTKNVSTTVKDASGKETTIEQAPRIQYQSGDNTYEVATMDDGLKFVGNDGKEVTRKLNSTLSLTGGITDGDALKKASGRNLGVRSDEKGDGLEIVMTDTPDFTKVTVGEGDDTTGKITIGKQTVTGKKSDGSDGAAQTGNYITGLENKAWDKDNVVENRAATEGQLRDIAGSITNQTQGGGFALTSDEKGDDKIVKQDLGKAIQIRGDTTYKTDGSVEKAGNIKTSIDNGAIKVRLNKDVDLGNDGSVKAGNTTINQNGVDTNKVKVGDITITNQGINGGSKQITNIASGIDGKQYADAGDNNAASIGDVKQLAQQEAQASAARNGKNITVNDDHTVNLNDHITLGDDKDKTKQVSIDGKGAKITAGDGVNTVTMDGTNGQVTIGSGDKTLTLGQQANGAGDKNPATGNFLNGLDNRNWDGEHIQNGRAATEDQLKTVSDKVKSGRVFQGDDGHDVTVGLGDTLKIQGGAKDVSSDNNIGIVKGADDTLNVRLAKDLTGLGSVTTGNTTINNGGLTIKTGDANRTITVQDGNVNMGGNQIHHVAPGQAPDDAVNVSQLNATNYAVNKLDTRVNRVGANAAALAALHPLDFDPDDKWDFSAGYGHYKDANAAAVGAFYRPNEDTMFSVGGSFGGGENMVNAGVSVKLGQGNHVSTSRVAMAKEIKDLKKDVAALKAVVNQQSALIDKLTGVNAGELSGSDDLFPDVPANHWAYEYVTRLKQAGILTGYPDGNFVGDRMMTRYEFAAIVYRAIMAGAAANPSLNKDGTLDRLAKEFSGEMKYIRIDTIRKDRNGKPTIQRVRVIKEDENKA